MTDIFISFVNQDKAIAETIGEALDGRGFQSWYYTQKGMVGVRYIEQIIEALRESSCILLIVSSHSLNDTKKQVDGEVLFAFEHGKPIIPILVETTMEDLDRLRPVWRYAVAGCTAARWLAQDPDAFMEKLCEGLQQFVNPSGQQTPAFVPEEESEPPVEEEPLLEQSKPTSPEKEVLPTIESVELPGADIFNSQGILQVNAFSRAVQGALVQVSGEAQLLGHSRIGVPHITLVLSAIPDGLTQKTLLHFHVDPKLLRDSLRESLASGGTSPSLLALIAASFSERGLKCLAWAGTLAREEGVAEINERHLLLAVLSQTDGVTARVFSDLGLDVTRMAAMVRGEKVDVADPLNLAPDAFEIMRLAQVEACNNGYRTVETPYFIIGLSQYREGRFASALLETGEDIEGIQERMRSLMPSIGQPIRTPRRLTRAHFSERMQAMIRMAEEEVASRNPGRTGQEVDELALLRALSATQGSMTVEYLRMRGVDLQKLVDTLSPSGDDPAPKPGLEPPITLRPAAPLPPPDVIRPVEPAVSDEVVHIINTALIEATQLGFSIIETPFLVIAMLHEHGITRESFETQGFDPYIVQQVLRRAMPGGQALPQPPTVRAGELSPWCDETAARIFSPNVMQVMQQARQIAMQAGRQSILEWDVLLAFLGTHNGQTRTFLTNFGVDLERMKYYLTS